MGGCLFEILNLAFILLAVQSGLLGTIRGMLQGSADQAAMAGASQLDELAGLLGGELITPTHSAYEEARMSIIWPATKVQKISELPTRQTFSSSLPSRKNTTR